METTITTPVNEECHDYNSHKCNTCDGVFICVKPKYCPYCGRKIVVKEQNKNVNPCMGCIQSADCYGLVSFLVDGHEPEPMYPCERYEKYQVKMAEIRKDVLTVLEKD